MKEGNSHALTIICVVLMISLVYSRFMVTLCIIVLFILGLTYGLHKNFSARKYKVVWENNTWFTMSVVVYLLVLIGGIYSSDFNYLLSRLRIKAPFIILPIAFSLLPPVSTRQYRNLHAFLVILMLTSTIYVTLPFLINYSEMISLLAVGKPIPTPVNHIRFSLLNAMAALSGVILWKKKHSYRWDWEPAVYLGCAILIFLGMHLIGVRSGLIVVYAAMTILIFKMWDTKSPISKLMIIGALAIFPLFAYKAIPSFQQKINYTLYDWHQLIQGNGKGYSDSERLLSMKIGFDLLKEKPIFGIGTGDIKQAVHQQYKLNYPDRSTYKMPHNQFLSIGITNGITGLLIFIFAFIYPLSQKKYRNEPLFVILFVTTMFSFMVENTIENSIGVAMYTFFGGLGANYLKH